MNFLTNFLTVAMTAETNELVFEPMSFVENLQYMGVGMLVIFVVIGIIILCTKLVNFLFSE